MRVHLIREWTQAGIEIDLVVSRDEGPLREQVPKTVRTFVVAPRHPLQFPAGFLHYLRARKPTHVLAAGTDISALTLLVLKFVGARPPSAISIHIQLSRDLELSSGLARLKTRAAISILRRMVPVCRAVIAVSQGTADDLRQWLPLREGQLHVIYNPTVTPESHDRMQAPLTDCPVPAETPWILYAGRLVPTKGLEVLIDAFGQVAARTSAHLVLMGDGPLIGDISTTIRKRDAPGRIHLVNFQSNPLPWMREATVLALPSRNEGLPNVLIEAMACGTQIVSTDCPSGPAEILNGGEYGQLVPVGDASALAEALLRSLDGTFHVHAAALRKRAAEFSSERAAARYLAALTCGPGGI